MNLNFYTPKKFTNKNIIMGFFTKNDGFSKNNYSSLNCSFNSGDSISNVSKNIKKAEKKIKLDKRKLKTINQIHSNKVVFIDDKNYLNNLRADAMISQDKNISLAILTADCCPIFFFDDDASFIACVHSGWKGCYKNIVEKTFLKLKKIQNNTKKIRAIIGPCINKINFEVKPNIKKKFCKKKISYKQFFLKISSKNKYLFDMRKLIEFQLHSCSINNIEHIDIDTYSNKNLFFSHRRATHKGALPTGRMINIIGFNR